MELSSELAVGKVKKALICPSVIMLLKKTQVFYCMLKRVRHKMIQGARSVFTLNYFCWNSSNFSCHLSNLMMHVLELIFLASDDCKAVVENKRWKEVT